MQVELDYLITDGLTAGVNLSYDEAFDTRVSGNISYRFGSNSSAAETKKKAWQKPTIKALPESVKNRNIRVHDAADPDAKCYGYCGYTISTLFCTSFTSYLARPTQCGALPASQS